eukprot:gnl/TRDRNA2_/TRDRNA2_197983_c0_seq1.p1 gnl/TRDRNA2_/TRDRNA2_197983_c0~~gnl/TRDRNA2_/TRDRNA2_197983_c0_seq1.p1  ORF type:complete len:628 (+),score=77.29 gnl/TRDRNA2_/TRDRNA2_197983_c0_seq1:88-1971(+)
MLKAGRGIVPKISAKLKGAAARRSQNGAQNDAGRGSQSQSATPRGNISDAAAVSSRERQEFGVSSELPALSACRLEAPEELLRRLRDHVDDPALADFTCPICLDTLWQPVRTVCGHAFCEGCLLKAVLAQLGNLQPDVSCPLCRHPLHVDDVSVDQALLTRIRLVLTEKSREARASTPAVSGRVHRGLAHNSARSGSNGNASGTNRSSMVPPPSPLSRPGTVGRDPQWEEAPPPTPGRRPGTVGRQSMTDEARQSSTRTRWLQQPDEELAVTATPVSGGSSATSRHRSQIGGASGPTVGALPASSSQLPPTASHMQLNSGTALDDDTSSWAWSAFASGPPSTPMSTSGTAVRQGTRCRGSVASSSSSTARGTQDVRTCTPGQRVTTPAANSGVHLKGPGVDLAMEKPTTPSNRAARRSLQSRGRQRNLIAAAASSTRPSSGSDEASADHTMLTVGPVNSGLPSPPPPMLRAEDAMLPLYPQQPPASLLWASSPPPVPLPALEISSSSAAPLPPPAVSASMLPLQSVAPAPPPVYNGRSPMLPTGVLPLNCGIAPPVVAPVHLMISAEREAGPLPPGRTAANTVPVIASRSQPPPLPSAPLVPMDVVNAYAADFAFADRYRQLLEDGA